MKALIWISTFLVGTLINTLIGYVIGIRAGAVLLYIVEYYIAKKLCEKLDEYKSAKESSVAELSSEHGRPIDMFSNNQEINKQVEFVNEQSKLSVEETSKFKTISYCRRCGFKLVEGSEFCSNCGTKIEKESEV